MNNSKIKNVLVHCFLIVILTTSGMAYSYNLTTVYSPGDEVYYEVVSKGQKIGVQKATCLGWNDDKGDSTFAFSFNSTMRFQRSGKTMDQNTDARADYLSNSLPKFYEYEMEILNVKINHQGVFNSAGYSGITTRVGVEMPFSYPSSSGAWFWLFDNNSALQWEIVVGNFDLDPGDSIDISAMLPQVNQQAVLSLKCEAPRKIEFGNQKVVVDVISVSPANQVLYFNSEKQLLRADDKTTRISVRRLPSGEKTELAGSSFFSLLMKRLPGYAFILLIAVFWLFLFSFLKIQRFDVILLFVGGAVLFWLSLQLLMPLQNLYMRSTLSQSSSTSIYMVLLGSALLFALVEESCKFVLSWLRIIKMKTMNVKVAIALGAATGAGFGFLQVAYMSGFFGDGSLMFSADLTQRAFLIGVNTATGALIGSILALKIPLLFLLIPLGLKTMQNYLVVFLQKGIAGSGFHLFATICILIATVVIIFLLNRNYALEAKKRGRKGKG